jgi:hypothetical protein
VQLDYNVLSRCALRALSGRAGAGQTAGAHLHGRAGPVRRGNAVRRDPIETLAAG